MSYGQRLPRPPDAGLLNAVRFASDPLRFLEGIQGRYEDAAEVAVPGGTRLVVLTNPALCHEAMARPDDFRRVPASGAAALIAKNGLVQSEGELWRGQRERIAPGFSSERVRTYADAVGRHVTRTAAEWRAAIDAGDPVRNLHRDMTSVTVRAVTEALFDTDIGAERAAEVHETLGTAAREFEISPKAIAPDWLPLPLSADAKRVGKRFHEMAETIIEERRAELEGEDPPKDMLGRLLLAEADPDTPVTGELVRDEVVTFLIAGHETTALGTTYALSLLSWHPEARERVRTEAREVLRDDDPTGEQAGRLEYTGRVFTETLRLYPPAWAVFRRAEGRQRLGDYTVEDGSNVFIPQWSVHRDGRYFERPREFDPDRWAERDPGANGPYFAFASGPHSCIGRGFALNGARLVIAGLLREFDVDVPEGALDDLLVTPTLRPGDGIEATLSRVD